VHSSTTRLQAAPRSSKLKSHDRGPKSEEETQTDFGMMDVLGNTPAPATGIDACTNNGFNLNNGLNISGSGVLLVDGEAFVWKPWIHEGRREGTIEAGGLGDGKIGKGHTSAGGTGSLKNKKGLWEVDQSAWGVLDLVWPKPGPYFIQLL
jgi:NADH dehydrogenase [ubiquinone] 1 alpha subcomplex assembly factor 3